MDWTGTAEVLTWALQVLLGGLNLYAKRLSCAVRSNACACIFIGSQQQTSLASGGFFATSTFPHATGH